MEPSLGLSSITGQGTYKSRTFSTTGLGLVGGYIIAKAERDWFAGLVSNLYYMTYSDSTLPTEIAYTLGFGVGGTMTYIPMRIYGSIDMASGGGGLLSDVGPGLRLGLTYFFNPLLAINVESKSSSAQAPSSGTEASISMINISISMPLEVTYPNVPWRERYKY
jgi:hypothetical protein